MTWDGTRSCGDWRQENAKTKQTSHDLCYSGCGITRACILVQRAFIKCGGRARREGKGCVCRAHPCHNDKGVRAARLGHRIYSNEVHERADPRGHLYYWIGGAQVTMPDIAGSDCNAVRDNFVSVTPLGDDLTLHARLPSLADALGSHADAAMGADAPNVDLAPDTPIGVPFE